MESKVLSKEAVDMVKNAGGESFRLCFQCGLCTASCPWNNVRTFMPHKIITQSKFGLIKHGVEDWWFCTTCNLCLSRCPRGVSTTEIMLALRRILVEEGRVPKTLRDALEAVFKQGNPWGKARSKRSEWAEGLGIRDVTQGEKADILLYVGCAPSYDPRVQKISKALVNIFSKAGIDVGILGNEETCCGNEVRRMGENGLFEMLVEHNLELFHKYHIDKIVTISPHCYNAIKNEYQDHKIEVKHYTQILAELMDTGKLTFQNRFEKIVTFHDPCYLGRHNGLYDEPRRILKGISGLRLVEMLDYRENSLCCGGGGGRMWVETEKEERFSDLRINQAVEVGAKVLATSCPFCVLNLEDSLLTMDKSDELEVKDISEIIQEVTEK